MDNKFLILILFVSISFASFPRPWLDDEWREANPNIWSYGFEYWWNLPEFDKTIDSLDFSGLDISPSLEVQKNIDNSMKYQTNSEKNINSCITQVLFAIGYFFPSSLFISVFADCSQCRTYQSDWITSVDSALLALEASEESALSSIASARASYERIKFLGLCDENYTGYGSSDCYEISTAFSVLDNHIQEGQYGQYPAFLSYADILNSELQEPIPDLSYSSTMLDLIWGGNGVIRSFSVLKNTSDVLASNAEKEFQYKVDLVILHQSQADDLLSALAQDQLLLISDGVQSKSTNSVGSISEQFEDLTEQSDHLSRGYLEIRLLHERVAQQSYLSNSLSSAENLDLDYLALIESLSSLKKNAQIVVSQKKSEAEDEISETEALFSKELPNSDGVDLLDTARQYLDQAQSATSLGESFNSYSNAAAYARAARTSGNFIDQAENSALFTSLENLIRLAEKDGINVVDEKTCINVLKSLGSIQSNEILQMAIDNIITKARNKYETDLLALRSTIYAKLDLLGSVTSSSKDEVNDYESGLIEDGLIIFPDAIGSLKELKSDYEETNAALDKYSSTLAANSMTTSSSPIFDVVKLDEPTEIILDVVLVNGPYEANNVKVFVETSYDIPFLYSDITSGREDVASLFTSDTGIFFILNSVAQYDVKRIVLHKSMIIAHTLSSEDGAIGIGNGFVRLTKTVDFELDYPVSNIELDNTLGNCLIDGTKPSTPLSAGEHILTSETTVQGYSEGISSISSTMSGSKTKLDYDVTILSEYDLSTLPITITNQNESEISSFAIVAYGATIKSKTPTSDADILVTLSNIEKDKQIILHVSYLINDPKTYIEDQLSELGDVDNEDIQDIIQSAQEQSDLGNYAEALELATEAQKLSSDYQKNQTKFETNYATLSGKANKEITEIDAILSTLDSNNSLFEKLKTRKTELETILTGNSSLADKVARLSGFDFNWLSKESTSFKKDSYSQLNDLKERLYLTGDSSTPSEFIDLESAINQLESTGQLKYLANISNALDAARFLVEQKELASSKIRDDLLRSFTTTKTEILALIDWYSTQYSAAKGTAYSDFFTESSSKLTQLLQDAEKLITKNDSQFVSKLAEINNSRARMENIIDSLREEAETKILTIGNLLTGEQIDASKKEAMLDKFETMKSLLANQDYVNVLGLGNDILASLEEPTQDSNLPLLAITALAILSVSVYIFTQNKPKEPKILPSIKN